MKKIQATFIGYGGDPCTVFSAYDSDTRVLVVGVKAKYRTERREGNVVITNDAGLSRDELFSEDKLKLSIDAFFALRNGIAADGGSSRITFADKAVSANPENAIEKDGVNDSGTKFRIAEGVTCAQMAVLATCLHAMKSDVIERAVTMAEQLDRLSRGQIFTV